MLYSLLLKINQTVREPNLERGELAKRIAEAVKADGCGVYFYESKETDFVLSEQDSYQRGAYYAGAWRTYRYPPYYTVEYLNTPEQAHPFGFASCLLLPLQMGSEQKIMGVALIGWKGPSPMKALIREDYQVLQIISQLLSDVYCVYPLVGKLKETLGLLTTVESYFKEYSEVTKPEITTPPPKSEKKADISPEILSARERQVLRLLSRGYNCREIGERLYFATSTVETYKQRLRRKLNLATRNDLVEYAIRNRIYED